MELHKNDVKNNVFGFGASNDAYAQYFTGESFLQGLIKQDDVDWSIANVSFAPGCINHWHQHTCDQVLICTAGEGWVQEEGREPHRMSAGDVYVVHKNTRHWHGAAKNSWFAHLSVTTGPAITDWQEPVDEQFYNSLD